MSAATSGTVAVARDDWGSAQAIWHAWPDLPVPTPVRGTCRRLQDALIGLVAGEARWGDIVALTRQVLLEHEARHDIAETLAVQLDPALPNVQQWAESGCDALTTATGLSVRALPWAPPSADPAAAAADIRQVYAGRSDRTFSVPADPFWTEALRFGHYTSKGQRQAARTLATAPPGATVILCLPTGQGKTEVALSSLLPATRNGGVAVIVVPTVVLAMDLERRLRKQLTNLGDAAAADHSFAYTGGLNDTTKATIKRDILTGKQRVVIAAPEAFMTGLSSTLDAAAADGRLTHLVIDEAHIVEQWGTDFRPEFQQIAAKRRTWLADAPQGRQLVTLAMSATLTAHQVRTLEGFFGAPGPVELVWASHTRAEPIYFVDSFGRSGDRDNAVLEAVGALPRPLILYTTTRQDTDHWYQTLGQAGIGRVARLTGDTEDAERREVIAGWRGEAGEDSPNSTRYDVMVGTSAFGLGVDMTDVRSVVHACLPETIDRYYQEVGRGGRDGRPAIAYLAAAPDDRHLATRLNRFVMIGDEKGWWRWRNMRDSARRLSDGRLEIDLSLYPRNVGMESTRNAQWNVRLLNLMQRAELISLEAPNDGIEPGEVDPFTTARRNPTLRVVTEHDSEVNNQEHFETMLSTARATVHREQQAALQQLVKLIGGTDCVAEILAEHYRLARDGGVFPTAVQCRSCPHCRRRTGGATPAGLRRPGPEPWPGSANWPSPPDPLTAFRGTSSWLSISWQDRRHFDDLVPDLLETLARRGHAVFGGPALTATVLRRSQRHATPHPIIVDADASLVDAYAGPLLWLVDDAQSPLPDIVIHRLSGPDPTYLVHPADLPDFDRPGTPLRYMAKSISLETLIRDSTW